MALLPESGILDVMPSVARHPERSEGSPSMPLLGDPSLRSG